MNYLFSEKVLIGLICWSILNTTATAESYEYETVGDTFYQFALVCEAQGGTAHLLDPDNFSNWQLYTSSALYAEIQYLRNISDISSLPSDEELKATRVDRIKEQVDRGLVVCK